MSGAKAIGRTAAAPAPFHRLLSDERLARRSAAGDAAAFGVLFERHHQPVYRYCRSIVGDPDEAADALQSTMEKALAAIARRDPAAPLRAWLFRIAHNESVSVLRRRGTAATEPLEPDAAIAPDVAVTAERRERLAQLVRDLRELPERQRGALLMREVGGLSHAEIAAAFAISVGAVKQSIYEARSALHDEARGRELSCEAIRRTLSEGDGRTARQRRIRAHLRGCEDCRLFHAGLRARRADLAALTPLLPGPAAAAVLAAITGAGTSGGGGLLAGLLGGGGASSALAKSAAVGAVTVTAGAGAVTLSSLPGEDVRAPRAPAKAVAAPGGAAAELARPAPEDALLPASAPVRPADGTAPAGDPGEGGRRVSGDDGREGDERSGPDRDEDAGERAGRRDRDDDEDREDRSGPGDREDRDDDREDDEREDSSGPGPGGADDDEEPEDHSGPGGGEDDEEREDRSGPSGSGSGEPADVAEDVPDPDDLGGEAPEGDPDD
jgi:RNA polymerase sigma factor (sigma-70 family)